MEICFSVIKVPGHTCSHVVYHTDNCLFFGDTLFANGCGRLIEGTPKQMPSSLEKIAALTLDTLNTCAHKYTLDKLVSVKVVEPNSELLLKRIEDTISMRARGQATPPSKLSLEKATNPFIAMPPAKCDPGCRKLFAKVTTIKCRHSYCGQVLERRTRLTIMKNLI